MRMKLTLRKLTLVSAILMTLCVVRRLFSEIIREFLLSGHPIRSSLFGDMMWCVSAMAIALFFWGLWRFRDEVPRLDRRRVIGLVSLGVIVVACYVLNTIVFTNWAMLIERLVMAMGL